MSKIGNFFRRNEQELFFLIWALSGLLSLALAGAGIYVLYHFASKYW